MTLKSSMTDKEKSFGNIPKREEQYMTYDQVVELLDSFLQNYNHSIRIGSGKLIAPAVQLQDRGAVPTTGTWQRGTIINVAGVLYICTVTGTPGTWVKVGTQS